MSQCLERFQYTPVLWLEVLGALGCQCEPSGTFEHLVDKNVLFYLNTIPTDRNICRYLVRSL